MRISNTGNTFPNLLKLHNYAWDVRSYLGWAEFTVRRDVNDSIVIAELDRYAMEMWGAHLQTIYQNAMDVILSTENTDRVHVTLYR